MVHNIRVLSGFIGFSSRVASKIRRDFDLGCRLMADAAVWIRRANIVCVGGIAGMADGSTQRGGRVEWIISAVVPGECFLRMSYCAVAMLENEVRNGSVALMSGFIRRRMR